MLLLDQTQTQELHCVCVARVHERYARKRGVRLCTDAKNEKCDAKSPGSVFVCVCVLCVKRESRDTDLLARDEWEEGWMRSAGVRGGRSRCKLEKFPYGYKMSATLLIEFQMCARCFTGAFSAQFLRVCIQHVFMRVCFRLDFKLKVFQRTSDIKSEISVRYLV